MTDGKRYRAYLMKFEPKWPPMSEAFVDRVMREADFCMEAPRGLKVGETFRVSGITQLGENGSSPRFGVRMKVVELHHFGKVATVEEAPE